MYKLTLVLGLLSSAFAVETTTLLLLGFDQQSIVASIISSDSTATTYGLACPSGTDASDCGVPPNFIFTQGPSTMHYDYSLDADDGSPATVEADCQITTDHGMCTSQYANAGPSMIGGSGSAFPYSNYGTDIGAQAVTIVGDAAAPGATGSTSVASTSATTTSSAAQQTESSGSSKTSSGSSTATSSQTGSSSSTKVSTGGMPMITGHPQWIIGGAAAAVAFAAM